MCNIWAVILCQSIHYFMISKDGDSALMLASRCGHTNVAMKLVEAGANLDLQDKVCVKLAIVMQSHILVKYIAFCEQE